MSIAELRRMKYTMSFNRVPLFAMLSDWLADHPLLQKHCAVKDYIGINSNSYYPHFVVKCLSDQVIGEIGDSEVRFWPWVDMKYYTRNPNDNVEILTAYAADPNFLQIIERALIAAHTQGQNHWSDKLPCQTQLYTLYYGIG